MWPIIAIAILVILLAFFALTFLAKGQQFGDRLYMVYYEDGLWDLYLGAILLLLGVAEWFETSLIGIIPAILYPILLAAKQAITAPRLRPEELPAAQGARRRLMSLLVLGLALLFGLLVFALLIGGPFAGLRPWLDRYLLTVLWLAVIALFVIWGYFSGAMRLFGYAALFLVALAAGFWLDWPLYSYALGLGAIISVTGVVLTVRFVHAHPKLAPG
ncbi:MAG: hypothetical protein R3C14_16555 [Caldilineaceae bacterium]